MCYLKILGWGTVPLCTGSSNPLNLLIGLASIFAEFFQYDVRLRNTPYKSTDAL